MKNFKKYYEKINTLVDKSAPSPKSVEPSKGIIQRPVKKEVKQEGKLSAEQQVAKYVEIIRKQKKELLNGKS